MRKEFNPGFNITESSISNMERVQQLAQIGISRNPMHHYFHGMSLETLKFILETGYIPGRNRPAYHSIEEVRRDELYVVGNHPLSDRVNQNPIQCAAMYAEKIAQIHLVIKSLNLSMYSLVDYNQAVELIHYPQTKISRELFYTHGEGDVKKEKYLRNKIVESRRMKGLVIGLNDAVEEHYEVSEADEDGTYKIYAPQGVTLDYLSGIYPLGTQETRYIDGIKRLLSQYTKQVAR